MIITITANLRLKSVPAELKQALLEKLEFPNPKWLENERLGRWNRGTPRMLKFYVPDVENDFRNAQKTDPARSNSSGRTSHPSSRCYWPKCR
jgi:hypothetical protein